MIRESLAGDRIGCQEQSPQESPAGTGIIRILIHWLLRSNKNIFLWKWKHLCGKWLWYTKSRHKTPPLWTSSDYCRLKLLVNSFIIVSCDLKSLYLFADLSPPTPSAPPPSFSTPPSSNPGLFPFIAPLQHPMLPSRPVQPPSLQNKGGSDLVTI